MSKTKLWKSLNEAYRSMREVNQKPYISLVDGEWILIGTDGKDVKNFGKNKAAALSALEDMFPKKDMSTEGAFNRMDYDIKNPEEAKPDFLDLDKDGDKEEPMKKAAKDAKEAEDQNEMFGLSKIEKAAKRLNAVHRNSDEFEDALKSLSKELTVKELGQVGKKLYKNKFNTASRINDKDGMVAAIARARRRKEDIAAA